MLRKSLVVLVCCLMCGMFSADLYADTVISGDLCIRDGGDLVFSDGSVQSKAQV